MYHISKKFERPAAVAVSTAALILGLGAVPAMAAPVIGHESPEQPAAALETGRPLTNLPQVRPGQLPLSTLRTNNALPAGAQALKPGFLPGSANGSRGTNSVAPNAYGNSSPLSIAPYTMARASASGVGLTAKASEIAVTAYPWKVTGQLSFQIAGKSYVCSASLISPALLVTAAHCVFEFGTNSKSGWHTNFVFSPAKSDSTTTAPFGTWSAKQEWIPTVYYNGTDTCTQTGVVCSNDIAIIILNPNTKGQSAGSVLGWYGYGWNGYSYVNSFGGASLSSITQLGYPVAFDNGAMMERNDGIGAYWANGNLKNTILGSAMTGGSSGGPWLVNFGTVPTITGAASLGNQADADVVVGVTSWGYTTVGDNTQGASFFGQNTEFPNASYPDAKGINRGAGNIGALVASACNATPTACS